VQGAFLVASWVLLIVSLSSGLYVLWRSVKLRSFYPILFNTQPYLRQQFSQLNLSLPDILDKSADILRTVVDGVVNPIGSADKAAQFSTTGCMVSFEASMLCLLVHALLRSGFFGL
jgi:hypothetical protein